ncbi:hypothetical protein RJT34_15779 [Clitoria ternatea]|uniref:C2H2-type domain-containing protein n=1 Tax=Clitoria ternatea TaxID=43366 RepID=A0AAN9J7H9_CLITE
MEQGQCWMWTKRKYSMSSSLDSPSNNHPSSFDDSWEEQAFAKDASGSGCIWPPRSYSCSFCRREFRSAQALGGHMNVHRRDRARLKQPCSPQNETLSHDLENTHPHPQNPIHHQNSFTSLGYLNHPLSGNNSPSSNPCSHHVLASPTKVLATSSNMSCREKPQIPLYSNNSSSIFRRFHETSPPIISSKSWSNLTEDFGFYSPRFEAKHGNEKNLKRLESGYGSEGGDDAKTDEVDVSVNLNLFVCQALPPVQFETTDGDTSFKKRRTDASSIQFFPKACSVDRHLVQSQMFEFSPSSIEEVDLELRLGYRPKV